MPCRFSPVCQSLTPTNLKAKHSHLPCFYVCRGKCSTLYKNLVPSAGTALRLSGGPLIFWGQESLETRKQYKLTRTEAPPFARQYMVREIEENFLLCSIVQGVQSDKVFMRTRRIVCGINLPIDFSDAAPMESLNTRKTEILAIKMSNLCGWNSGQSRPRRLHGSRGDC